MVRAQAIFKSADIIFIDTNIFIYALERSDTLGELARDILFHVKRKAPRTYTSTLTIEEILVGVFKEHLEEKIPTYLEFIAGGGLITIADFDRDRAILAARLRSEYKVKTPDAIQLATALSVKATKFITADKRVPLKVDHMRIYTLM